MGTIGYGDISASHDSIAEMIVACILVVIGTTTMSYLIGAVMGLVSSINPGQIIRKDKIRLISGYSMANDIPENMTKKLQKIENYALTAQGGFNIDDIFSRFPAMLKREVLQISTSELLFVFPILKKMDISYPGIIEYIWPLFECYQAVRDDYLWNIGEDVSELYFVYSGELRIGYMDDDEDETVKSGQIIGEASLLVPRTVYCIYCCNCIAEITTQLFVLNRDKIQYIEGISQKVYMYMQDLISESQIKQPIFIEETSVTDEIKAMGLVIRKNCPPRSLHEYLDVNMEGKNDYTPVKIHSMADEILRRIGISSTASRRRSTKQQSVDSKKSDASKDSGISKDNRLSRGFNSKIRLESRPRNSVNSVNSINGREGKYQGRTESCEDVYRSLRIKVSEPAKEIELLSATQAKQSPFSGLKDGKKRENEFDSPTLYESKRQLEEPPPPPRLDSVPDLKIEIDSKVEINSKVETDQKPTDPKSTETQPTEPTTKTQSPKT